MPTRMPKALPWILTATLAVATLGPHYLRPDLGLPLDAERFLGFAIVGAVFSPAYPRHRLRTAAAIMAAAALLEGMQQFLPGRHAHFSDFLVKAEGAGFGSRSPHS